MADWEVEYDTLALTSDLETVAEMPDNLEGRLLADGSPVVPALLPFDRELLVERGIPTDEVDEADSSQCLLLPRGYLSHLRAGDLIGLRLTDRGIVLQPVDENTVSPDTTRLGEVLHSILDYCEPVESSIGVLTACADDASLFTPAASAALNRNPAVRPRSTRRLARRRRIRLRAELRGLPARRAAPTAWRERGSSSRRIGDRLALRTADRKGRRPRVATLDAHCRVRGS
ncbi:hypothetical protein GCM10009765_15690 [Fodinicola feengrottensis]|uniref:Uncharacterized protein n=1 Tax=Fodinicola feengrottensis TaxID=435914 RepID=A0ABN2G8D5_9ACTN